MARRPDSLAVECPTCAAQPGQDCVRLSRLASGQLIEESTRPHPARREALEAERRKTRTIR